MTLHRLPHTGTALDAIQELTPEGIEFIQQHIQLGQELEAQFPYRGVESPKRATAYHEAAHAVVHHYHRHEVEYCKIWSVPTGWAGITWLAIKPDDTHPDTPPRNLLREAQATLAGWCGEMLFAPDQFRPTSSWDENLIGKGLCLHAIARSLLREHRIRGEKLRQIMTGKCQRDESNLDL
jgi:ATP-dependent Zn proteases